MLYSCLCRCLSLKSCGEAGTDSVVVAEVSGTIEEGASCSHEATDDDRRSVVVTGKIKAAEAC